MTIAKTLTLYVSRRFAAMTLAMLAALLFFTSPAASHALARAALLARELGLGRRQ